MKKINALVVDDSKDFTKNVVEFFKNSISVNIVGVLDNGLDVVPYIRTMEENIDVILLDLILPGKDGLGVIEELEDCGIRKHIIVLSSYEKDYTVKMVKKHDIDYFMLKPCDLRSINSRICDVMDNSPKKNIYQNEPNEAIQMRISEVLHELGVPSQIMGYQYLREGILMLYKSQELAKGITKVIYPEIASRYNTTPSRVERAIRHAIEVSWARVDYDIMNKMFGNSVDFDRAKPTNSEFMVTVSDCLRLNNDDQSKYICI